MSIVDRLRRREHGLPRVVTIGGQSLRTLQNRFIASKFTVDLGVSDMTKDPAFTTLPDPVEIRLKKLSPASLGFKRLPEYREMVEAAGKRGFDLLPAETALHLRLAYEHQPMGEGLVMGMEPILDRGEYPRVFYLAHNPDGLFLSYAWTDMGASWPRGAECVFAERK